MILEAAMGVLLFGAADRVGVICVGDAQAAGEVQATLEVRLRTTRPTMRGADQLGALARPAVSPTPAPGAAAFATESSGLFSAATDAFFDGSVAFALDRL